MVVYLSIVFLTVLFLTYIAYKAAAFFALGLPPKMLVACGFFACFLAILMPYVVASVSSVIMWLIVLLSLLLLSTFAFFRVTDSVETADTNSAAALPEAATEETPEEALEETPAQSPEEPAEVITEFSLSDSAAGAAGPAVEDPVNTGNPEVREETVSADHNHQASDGDFSHYVELGFAAREAGDYSAAVIAFQKAIDLEPDNPAILYIISEICALLKLQGFYKEAIHQLEKGRDLAVSFRDEKMVGQFIDSIAYFRILRNLLGTYGMSFTPYPCLPEDVKSAIEEEFRQWKNQ